MITVYVALGSNVGNREENLRRAIALLGEAGVVVKKISSIYETEPLDYLEQDWFLNGVVEAETNFGGLELLRVLPLAEIAPEVRHPSWSGNAREMLERSEDRSEVRRFT